MWVRRIACKTTQFVGCQRVPGKRLFRFSLSCLIGRQHVINWLPICA
jgi:hypothetical protein